MELFTYSETPPPVLRFFSNIKFMFIAKNVNTFIFVKQVSPKQEHLTGVFKNICSIFERKVLNHDSKLSYAL